MQALSTEANEMLPVFNKASSKHYSSTVGARDWAAPPPYTAPPSTPGFRNLSNLPLGAPAATKRSLLARKFSQEHKNNKYVSGRSPLKWQTHLSGIYE